MLPEDRDLWSLQMPSPGSTAPQRIPETNRRGVSQRGMGVSHGGKDGRVNVHIRMEKCQYTIQRWEGKEFTYVCIYMHT